MTLAEIEALAVAEYPVENHTVDLGNFETLLPDKLILKGIIKEKQA